MDYAKESLRLHYEWKGKIEVIARAKVDNKDALSLAYTPGVAQPCLEIQKYINKSYELTRRSNLVAVITEQVCAVRKHIEAAQGALAVGHGYVIIHLEAIHGQVFT